VLVNVRFLRESQLRNLRLSAVARKPRIYKKGAKGSEYDYHGKPEQIKRRSARNKARRKAKCKKGQEVHHKDMNPRNNKRSNLKCVSKKTNRTKQPKRK